MVRLICVVDVVGVKADPPEVIVAFKTVVDLFFCFENMFDGIGILCYVKKKKKNVTLTTAHTLFTRFIDNLSFKMSDYNY